MAERGHADIGDMMVERNVLSIVTPSVRTALETALLFPPSVIVLVSPSCLSLAAVPTTMASDLSGLRESVEYEQHRSSRSSSAANSSRP